MRYLSTLDNIRVGGALFVAGWFCLKNLEGEEVEKIAKPWLETQIDLGKVKSSLNHLTVVLSDDDPYNCIKENKEKFEKELGAKIIIEHGKGHFRSGDDVTELLSALNAILEMAKEK